MKNERITAASLKLYEKEENTVWLGTVNPTAYMYMQLLQQIQYFQRRGIRNLFLPKRIAELYTVPVYLFPFI